MEQIYSNSSILFFGKSLVIASSSLKIINLFANNFFDTSILLSFSFFP